MTIRFANRAIAQFDQSWCTRAPRDSFAVFGTQGHILIEDLEGTKLTVQVGRDAETIDVAPSSAATRHPVVPVVADFVRALTGGGPVRCSGADALRTSQIIELADQAAREQRTVDDPTLVGVRWMSDRKLRLGVVGCGYVARLDYFPVLAREDVKQRSETVAVCDVSEQAAKEAQEMTAPAATRPTTSGSCMIRPSRRWRS